MQVRKTKEEAMKAFKDALQHKKEWQQRFVETYATPGMKVEFF